MPNVTNPSQVLVAIEFTQDQLLHVAAALAGGLTGESKLPPLFLEAQWELYGMFMEHLSPDEQKRVEESMLEPEDLS